MARSKVVIEDSFDNILADMRRLGMDAVEVTRNELATTIGEIIDNTPRHTGMAAMGWTKAADALGVGYHIEYKVSRSDLRSLTRSSQYKDDPEGFAESLQKGSESRRTLGRRMGGFTETVSERTIRSGKRKGVMVKKAEFIAGNAVPHLTFIEYGFAYLEGADPLTKQKGITRRVPGKHVIRDAVRRMKQRLGPHLYKVIKANVKRPKRYKRKKKTITV